MNANAGDQMEPEKTTRSDRTERQRSMDEWIVVTVHKQYAWRAIDGGWMDGFADWIS